MLQTRNHEAIIGFPQKKKKKAILLLSFVMYVWAPYLYSNIKVCDLAMKKYTWLDVWEHSSVAQLCQNFTKVLNIQQ